MRKVGSIRIRIEVLNSCQSFHVCLEHEDQNFAIRPAATDLMTGRPAVEFRKSNSLEREGQSLELDVHQFAWPTPERCNLLVGLGERFQSMIG